MIFARRALQRRLDELRKKIGDDAVNGIVARLNVPGKDRVAAMWEVVVFHGLAACGALESELALPTGRRPDVWFNGNNIQFVADVTSVSDEGLDDQNPHAELAKLIEKAKAKLRLPIGGLELRVHSRQEKSSRGSRRILKLPPRKQLVGFVDQEVLPKLREQLDAGAKVLRLSVDDDDVGIEIVIDPTRSPISTYGFAAYDVPTIKDRNPLYNALKSKAGQLRSAPGVAGVILGDADCAALAERQPTQQSVSAEDIAKELLRQYSSLDFVLLLSVGEDRRPFFPPTEPRRHVHAHLMVQDGSTIRESLSCVFRAMIEEFPQPVNMPANGALRAREQHYEMGYHGGNRLSGPKIRLSSRELVEVLAGLRTLDDNGARNVDAARRLPSRPSDTAAAFSRQLSMGRLPIRINLEKTDENDNDDWVEFEFGDPDPAIAPFK
ncbi:hypothetical protein G6K93_16010 [Agrobacterium rhizogenes]|uniref:hypothetical protein n=1 Tax=Rhizobium rhizogenes TaxID=359 RepID=UPI001572A560|nr:hypothetical protein [Rhizobium rhizogenes]NTF55041.1 hypothetical protein [Rhizobium rhizogenes]NTF74621.1 hypothetical protein [Rhizobium rhizogenes]NTF98392.1 hypothetical protein [Rhizobium rhizogenes]NTH55860.1 hypothetical protein [Rhizobium rhizogenes]NTH75480.1 hypothetical protein [Rhizobium rhizogenes]